MSTDNTEDTTDDNRPSGPHPRFESVRFFRADQSSNDESLTPSERLNAARDGSGGSYESTIHRPSTAADQSTVQFDVRKGDDTLAERVEVDVSNSTTDPISDTVSIALFTVETAADGTETTTPLWSLETGADGDTTTADHDITLAPDGVTTVAVSGNGAGTTSDYVNSDDDTLDAAGGGLLPLPLGTTVRVTVKTTNESSADPALSVDRTRFAVSPTPWEQWWRDDGALLLRGPQGADDIRVFYPPAEDFALFPGGLRGTNQTYDADETGTVDDADALGGNTASQYLRSDTDDEMGGVLTHTGSDDSDSTTPRGDGERERWSSSLGGFALSVTGGHGRVNQGWNCIYDGSTSTWRYAVGNEPAMAVDINGGSITLQTAPPGTAGDPITWNEVEFNGQVGEVRFNGATLTDATIPSGPTADRPTSQQGVIQYFDTDLNKPIWFNGTDWVDAQGTVV